MDTITTKGLTPSSFAGNEGTSLEDERERQKDDTQSFIAGMLGLSGVSLLVLLQLLEQPVNDLSQRIAFYSLIIAIPSLVGTAISHGVVTAYGRRELSPNLVPWVMVQAISPWFAFAGITCYLWHFSRPGAVVFMVASAVAFVMHMVLMNLADRSKMSDSKQQRT